MHSVPRWTVQQRDRTVVLCEQLVCCWAVLSRRQCRVQRVCRGSVQLDGKCDNVFAVQCGIIVGSWFDELHGMRCRSIRSGG